MMFLMCFVMYFVVFVTFYQDVFVFNKCFLIFPLLSGDLGFGTLVKDSPPLPPFGQVPEGVIKSHLPTVSG